MQYLTKTRFLAVLLLAVSIVLPGLGYAQSVEGIRLETAQGPLNMADLKGQVVYLDFWASWCAPCRKSFPWLNQLQKKYATQGFKVIAVNLDKERELASKFLKNYPADFQIAYDANGKVAQKLAVKGMPSSYLIDRNGQIKASHIGFLEKDIPELENRIKALLKK